MRRRRRPIRLFSFSFVDILATTIGVLIFILLMAVLNQSGLVEYSQWTRKLEEAEDELAAATRAEQEGQEKLKASKAQTTKTLAKPVPQAAEVRKEHEKLAAENRRLANKAARARTATGRLRAEVAPLRTKVAQLQQTLAKLPLGEVYKLPKAQQSGNRVPVHVDCHRDRLVILGSDVTKGADRRETCRAARIADPTSAFGRLLRRVKATAVRPSGQEEVVVLWIRPDGIAVANRAMAAARKARVPLGWEPADRDWRF